MTFRFLLRLETVSLHEKELQNDEGDKYAPTIMYFMRKSEDRSSVLKAYKAGADEPYVSTSSVASVE